MRHNEYQSPEVRLPPVLTPATSLSIAPRHVGIFAQNIETRRCAPQILLAGLFLLITMSGPRAQGLDPGRPPGGNLNLTNFYLGLPVDSSGGTTGDSASITAPQLTAGYSNALYFYTGPDGAMTFWAPVTGATTPNSSYPRSELREQLTPPSNSTNWLPYGNHLLSAQCRVTQVPSTGKVIIGQIHCYTGNARPLLKLQFNNGVVEALVKTNSNFDADYKLYFQNVGLSNSSPTRSSRRTVG